MRLSTGSAAKLGLIDMNQLDPPTTCYVMLGDQCENNCQFCAQSVNNSQLSRIDWPEFGDVTEKINQSDFKRVCLQCTSVGIKEVKEIAKNIIKPVSISYNFQSMDEVERLIDFADKISIPLDAATNQIYKDVKADNFYKKKKLIETAAKKYPGKISTHLIAGLGETEQEMKNIIDQLRSLNVTIGLFAFTPIKGTKFENQKQPDLAYYRRLQKYLKTGFQTSGCRDCNRPYYNEKPTGPIYNYPRKLTEQEKNAINNR